MLVVRAREAQRLHDYEAADRTYRDALALGLDLENQGVIATCIAGFAGLATKTGHYREAALLFGCAGKLLSEVSTSLEREQMTFGLDEARASLGDEVWQVAWAEGEAMPMQEAIALAQSMYAKGLSQG